MVVFFPHVVRSPVIVVLIIGAGDVEVLQGGVDVLRVTGDHLFLQALGAVIKRERDDGEEGGESVGVGVCDIAIVASRAEAHPFPVALDVAELGDNIRGRKILVVVQIIVRMGGQDDVDVVIDHAGGRIITLVFDGPGQPRVTPVRDIVDLDEGGAGHGKDITVILGALSVIVVGADHHQPVPREEHLGELAVAVELDPREYPGLLGRIGGQDDHRLAGDDVDELPVVLDQVRFVHPPRPGRWWWNDPRSHWSSPTPLPSRPRRRCGRVQLIMPPASLAFEKRSQELFGGCEGGHGARL